MRIYSLYILLSFSANAFKLCSHKQITRSFVSMKVKKNNIDNTKLYIPKNDNQILYADKLSDPETDLVIGVGPAGTGKTLFPCQEAVNQMMNHDKKIVITRPQVSVNEDIGFLPGDINKKMDPWVRPILDILEEYYTPPQIEDLLRYKKVEIIPLGFMRGRTFKNSFILGDEMQNATPEQMMMLLTRLGDESKMVLTGDLEQTDINNSGLRDILNKINKFYNRDNSLMDKDGISMINFDNDDILRHKFVAKIMDIYSK